ncbi:MAG: metallophosphoesterase [Synechococcaceae bacterium WB8_1B_136]|nr:metallophosphoesterase [Synechococcaceae bacterium WB8_1B_136]
MRRRDLLRWISGGAAFATAPLAARMLAGSAAAQGSIRFLAVADTGSGDANQRAVGAQMAAVHRRSPVDLVVLGGDNIYPSGDMALIEQTFRRPYSELLAAGVPFHAVLGNHDIRTDNGNPQVAYRPFGMKGRYYNLRRGDLELFMLDTNANADWQGQVSWLRTVLAASTAPWKVVVGHHPIYSSGFYGNDAGLRARLGALMAKHGVQLYINGHEHNYERSKPIDGIVYLVVGGGGASLRPVIATAQTARAASVFSFAEIEAGPRQLSVAAWDSGGRLLDRAVIASR